MNLKNTFLFFCNKFDNIYDDISNIKRNFTTLNVTDKFRTIFSKECTKITAQFVERMWFARKDIFKNNYPNVNCVFLIFV